MLNPIEIIEKLSQEHTATNAELLALLTCEDPYINEALREKAQAQAQKTFGNKIYCLPQLSEQKRHTKKLHPRWCTPSCA